MKKTLSLILAALMLASSMTACGKTNPPETEEETKAVETNAPDESAPDTAPAETDAPAASYEPSVVTENGAAQTHIVIAESANDTLKWAAEELVYHIKKVSGADVSVVNAVEEGSLPIIIAANTY